MVPQVLGGTRTPLDRRQDAHGRRYVNSSHFAVSAHHAPMLVAPARLDNAPPEVLELCARQGLLRNIHALSELEPLERVLYVR